MAAAATHEDWQRQVNRANSYALGTVLAVLDGNFERATEEATKAKAARDEAEKILQQLDDGNG